MADREEHRVQLSDRESGLVVTGRLLRRAGGVSEVQGTAEGIGLDNYLHLRPSSLEGVSSRWRHVWLGRIFRFEPRVNSNPRVPAEVRLRALETCHGDFDPRGALIRFAGASLGALESLSRFRSYSEDLESQDVLTRRYALRPESLLLHEADNLRITLEHRIRIGSRIRHRQMLEAAFAADVPTPDAAALLQRSLLLVCILTQSTIEPRTFAYADAQQRMAFELRHVGERVAPTPPNEWLADWRAMPPLLQRSLGPWLTELAKPGMQDLVTWFVSAQRSERTIESRFLLLCQCYEELSRRRIGRHVIDAESYRAQVVAPLREAIDKLDRKTIHRDLRSRLAAAVAGCNDWCLRDRIANSLSDLPRFSARVKEGIPDIRKRIEERRNKLSHGDPAGSPAGQAQFDRFVLEASVIRGLCLAEILRLAGLAPAQIDDLVLGDKEMRLFEWRCRAAS